MSKEYIIYCDESEESGRHYSNFYGGALVPSDHIDVVRQSLAAKKADLNLFGEVKWTKITANYEEKYIDLLDHFFDHLDAGQIKLRVMFTQNTVVPKNLTRRHYDEQYFILYYQFIKHAFGLRYAPTDNSRTRLRIYPDKLPDTDEQIARFKGFLLGLNAYTHFRRNGLAIQPEDIAEVRSHDHDVLQCLDIVIGAIHFRLNDKHRAIPDGLKRRGKRTRAKERVYRHINSRIRQLYPNFNIGITTGTQGEEENRWEHPYRHWKFTPRNSVIMPGSKRKK